MATPTHDYDTLEKEFLREPDLGIRELCRRHDIKGYSSVAAYARAHDWYTRKAQIRERAYSRTIEKVAERLSDIEADEISQFRSEVLTVARAMVYRVAEDLKDPDYRVRPEDFVKVVQMALLVTGQPTERTEERRLDIRATVAGLEPDTLRRIVEATRPALPDGAGPDPSGGASRTRAN